MSKFVCTDVDNPKVTAQILLKYNSDVISAPYVRMYVCIKIVKYPD